MENRITISICDEEYTFVAEEAPSYMQKVGSYVNDKMSELLDAQAIYRQSCDSYVEARAKYEIKKREYLQATGR